MITADWQNSFSDAPGPLEIDLAALPKACLHDHLDGGLRVGTVLELALEAGLTPPADTEEELAEWISSHANGESLEKYLEVFALTTSVMQTADQLRRVAREFVEDLVEDGVVYGEIRWAPEQHLEAGLSLDEAVEAVQSGLDDAVAAAAADGHEIRVGQLITAMRHADRAQQVAELAVRHRDRGVVGFDIAGAEIGFPPSRFTDAFTYLAQHHVPATVHAGEADGIESIREALVHGRAQRLGHGVRLADDISVQYGGVDEDGTELDADTGLVELGDTAAWVRDRQIPLEVCLSSNLQTGAVAADQGIAAHPIDLLVQLGFRVTVNPDNRLVSGVSLTDELYLLAETFGHSLAQLLQLQLNAVESAFLPLDEREELAETIVTGWAEAISGQTPRLTVLEADQDDPDDDLED